MNWNWILDRIIVGAGVLVLIAYAITLVVGVGYLVDAFHRPKGKRDA